MVNCLRQTELKILYSNPLIALHIQHLKVSLHLIATENLWGFVGFNEAMEVDIF
jgi:hypothetical protein